MNYFITEFQCDFFSRLRCCYKLYQKLSKLSVPYIMYMFLASTTQANALKGYEAEVHLSAKPSISNICFD